MSRIALLGSVAALALTGAHAQTAEQAATNPEACAMLAERLAADEAVEAEVRTDVEGIIAEGNVARCEITLTTWDERGAIDSEALALVATDEVSQRMIVQQEVEVAANVAVYQPPAEVSVEAGAADIAVTTPRQSVTVEEAAPQITVRQARPTVNVEIPQPRITVMMPEPEIIINWPDPTVSMTDVQPEIVVNIPDPVVNVTMPQPVVELALGDAGPTGLVELDDGRFAPEGATAEDLEPVVTVTTADAVVRQEGEAQPAEVIVNRAEPTVTYETEEPEVVVQQVGEAEVSVQTQAAPATQVEGAAPADAQQPAADPAAAPADPAAAPAGA
ncbi:MAG: hypothetical protein Q4F71_08345, partial [Paracoccus sp. (in: a-proteobacteria)]|nr:hypothetical protein [Paracoccus sp. (in: a-proteobacteria)]